jgi:lipid A disaccharide synthetase
MFGARGRFVTEEGRDYLTSATGEIRVPVVTNALAAAARARLVLTIPGTKTIELAALGKPAIALTPLNAPELVTINGPLTYLNRIPFFGIPLKRAVAVGVSRHFPLHTQPNMDAGASLIREVHGTVTPGRIARIALEAFDDQAWLAAASQALAALYREHVGASDRMAHSLLALAG